MLSLVQGLRDLKMNEHDLGLPGTKCRDTLTLPEFTILYYQDPCRRMGRLEERYQLRLWGR